MVFISNEKKLHFSAYSGHLQVLTSFLLKEFYIICLNCVVILRPLALELDIYSLAHHLCKM